MGLFPKKNDPISDRSRALNAEISALEARIKKLHQQVQDPGRPRLRSTVYPYGPATPPPGGEPVFEEVHQKQLTQSAEPAATAQHFNELGVRKFDLWAVFARLKKQMSGRPPANPKLINYLAAGSIQGLRPLRYEKRVARNRFFALVLGLAIICLGLVFYWRARHS
jgi:cell division protein FtsB